MDEVCKDDWRSKYNIWNVYLVGDSTGEVHSMKLSPNLRKQTREVKIALSAKDQSLSREFLMLTTVGQEPIKDLVCDSC